MELIELSLSKCMFIKFKCVKLGGFKKVDRSIDVSTGIEIPEFLKNLNGNKES